MALKDLQAATTSSLDAAHLAANPYIYPGLGLSPSAYASIAAPHNASVRVFYLRRYLTAAALQPLLTRVPAVCVDGDRHIETQDGATYGSLGSLRAAHPALISDAQRRLSRAKCVASLVTVLGTGGYGARFAPLGEAARFTCAVVSGAGPQFEAAHLDFADLFVEQDPEEADAALARRLPEYAHLSPPPPARWSEVLAAAGPASDVAAAARDPARPLADLPAYVRFEGAPGAVLDARAFAASLRECVHLWLAAFDALVAARGPAARGYFKLTAIGTGFFATLPRHHGAVNVGSTLLPLLLRCALDLLPAAPVAYPRLRALEFPDFSRGGLYTPTAGAVGGVRLVKAPMADALDFPDDVRAGRDGWVPGVLNPGDCFALVGNERGHGSVEAMIGCNSTLRFNQNYLWNEHVLDEERWEGVDV